MARSDRMDCTTDLVDDSAVDTAAGMVMDSDPDAVGSHFPAEGRFPATGHRTEVRVGGPDCHGPDPRDRMWLGVCTELAWRMDVDPLLVRLLFVVSNAMPGLGLLVYLVAARQLGRQGGLIRAPRTPRRRAASATAPTSSIAPSIASSIAPSTVPSIVPSPAGTRVTPA